MAGKLLDRTTGELLVLLITVTICGSVVAGGITVTIVRIFNPDVDVTRMLILLSDIINTLIGLLAGFLAGRGEASPGVQMQNDMLKMQQELRAKDAELAKRASSP